jgi:hypothetical protein
MGVLVHWCIRLISLVIAGLDPAINTGANACLAGGCRVKPGHDKQNTFRCAGALV